MVVIEISTIKHGGTFHFDENVDVIDSYVTKIKQVAGLLNYDNPEMLELLRNTLLSKTVLFNIQRK